MGHQTIFYALPDDIAAIEKAVRGLRPPACVIHVRSSVEVPRVVESLNLHENGRRWLFYYLVRECDVSAVLTEYVPTQGYWTVDSLRSPVISFTSCYFDGPILRRGRLYYVDGFYGENDAWIEKSEEFRTWAKAVFRVAKKHMKRYDAFYNIAPAAAAWVAQGGRPEP